MHDWVNWAANAIPFLLLIGLWFFFMRKMRTGLGPYTRLYEKQAELLEQQLAVLRQTNELLKKLIETR